MVRELVSDQPTIPGMQGTLDLRAMQVNTGEEGHSPKQEVSPPAMPVEAFAVEVQVDVLKELDNLDVKVEDGSGQGEVLPSGTREELMTSEDYELPEEQREFLRYIAERDARFEKIQELSQGGSNTVLDLYWEMKEYKRIYGVNPRKDEYMKARRADTRDSFLEEVKNSNGEPIRLPLLINGEPAVVIVNKLDIDGLGPFKKQVSIDIGTYRVDGVLETIGRSDLQIREVDGELIACGGKPLAKVGTSQQVDRSRLSKYREDSLIVDQGLLSDAHRKGLGSMLYSLGRYIASTEGAKIRIVEQDGSNTMGNHKGSFYIDALGGRLEEKMHPLGNLKVMPVFDTAETKEQPYKFGYWAPIK